MGRRRLQIDLDIFFIELRKAMYVKDLAKRIGISRPTLDNWLNFHGIKGEVNRIIDNNRNDISGNIDAINLKFKELKELRSKLN